MACSEPDELEALGLTAALCMKEVTVDMETKEFVYQKEKKTYTVCEVISVHHTDSFLTITCCIGEDRNG